MSELPKGWERVPLGKYIKLKNGFAFKSKDFVSKAGNTYPVIRISDIQNGKVSTEENAHVLEDIANFKFAIDKGDLLIAMSGATTGKTGVYTGQEVALQNQRVGNLKLVNSTTSCPRYRNYLIASLKQEIIKKAYGAAQPNISAKELESIEVNIAPFEEQKRIADKLDSVLAKVEAAQARLDKIPAILKRFRQSVLAAATSGELTKDWRANNECFLSLAPINIENDAYDVWKKTTKKDIPYTWRYFKLMEMGKIQGGGTPSKSISEYWDGDIPWVTPKDMKIAFISSSKINVTEIGVENSSAKFIEKDSILFVVRGMILAHSFPLAKNLKKVTVNQDMKAITPLEEVDSNYLLFAMQSLSPIFVELASSSTHGTKRLEAKMYNNVAIPVPPLREQLEIVRATQKLFTKAELIEKQYSLAKARINKLSQSVLAKAFKGELFARSVKSEIKDIENSVEAIHA